METITDYVKQHTTTKSDQAVDMILMKIGMLGSPSKQTFERLARAHKNFEVSVNPFDGKEHNYIELSAWLDSDPEMALRFMALGSILGSFSILTPKNMMKEGIPDELAKIMAATGLITAMVRQ